MRFVATLRQENAFNCSLAAEERGPDLLGTLQEANRSDSVAVDLIQPAEFRQKQGAYLLLMK